MHQFISSPEAIISRLSFTHLREIMSIDDPLVRYFYEQECMRCTWSVRELRRQIGTNLHIRVGLSKDPEKCLSPYKNGSNASVEVMLFKDRLEVWNPGTLPQGLTLDSLKGVHNSIPANPIIALPAYLAGYIERLGTGTTDVVETCVAAGLPAPEYKQEQNHFISVIWRKRTDTNGPQSGPQGKLAQRYRGLLETIVAKPTISKEDLAAQFKISLTTLKRDLKCLRQSYEITWIGWTQNGHWEVKELDKKKQ